jgi:DNA-binding transcriptional LysR family regulator
VCQRYDKQRTMWARRARVAVHETMLCGTAARRLGPKRLVLLPHASHRLIQESKRLSGKQWISRGRYGYIWPLSASWNVFTAPPSFSFMHTKLSFADARLLNVAVATAVYLVYLPVSLLSIARIFSSSGSGSRKREHSVVVAFSGGSLKLLPVRSWLRTALFGTAAWMLVFETAGIVMNVMYYLELRDHPQAVKGTYCPVPTTALWSAHRENGNGAY